MRYWTMLSNNRVGKCEERPSDSWVEISWETYCKEYTLDHNGQPPPADEPAPAAQEAE